MPYSLTAIQRRAFTQRLDLYRQTENNNRTGLTKTSNGVYYTLAYEDVRGRIAQTPAVATPGAIGRTDEYMVYTFDVLRLHIDQECDDGWIVYDGEADQWYTVQGTAQNRHWRAKTAIYKLARAEEPPLTEGSEPTGPAIPD